jgi:signal transduction histidine kinase
MRQEDELRERVVRLTDLVAQNEELHDRVRRAAARSAAFNERFLRRVSAELHDGPAQYLGLALLRIDQVAAVCEQQAPQTLADLDVIQGALGHAMQEVRGISAGLGLPHIETLSLADTVARVVRSHERTTKTRVEVNLPDQLPQVCLATKIATYRLIQEALSNATRHAGGAGQRVTLEGDGDWLIVSVSDKGPGFTMPRKAEWGHHMGLAGMRERVESLGGDFAIACRPGMGTQVTACLPCQATEEIL